MRAAGRRHPVAGFVVRRVATGVVTLLVASFLIFASVQLLPGDVASVVLGKNATPARVAALRSDLNLDRSLPQRYLSFLGNVSTGQFGNSSAALAQGRELPVWGVIETPLRNSLILALVTIALFVPLCLVLGALSALRAGGAADHAISVPALVASAMPEFLVGTLLIVIFFTQLDLFPPVAEIGAGETPFTHLDALGLPVLTLVSVSLALGIRLIRATMIDVLRADFVRMARLNGQPERRVVVRYALRNALGPGIQAIAQTLQYLLGGIIITESVFNYPGIGSKLVQAVSLRDIQEIGVIAMILAAAYILINVVADLLVMLAVPRLRTGA
ncbi:MAG: ABC transporter permease [Actinobacteria bacterium]|nr:ABC transporter permease [Actinomycetota bacterium]